MKGYLLDTHVALLAGHESRRLPAAIREAIAEGPSFLSVIAYWEVMVKSMKGGLDVGDPRNGGARRWTHSDCYLFCIGPNTLLAFTMYPPLSTRILLIGR